MKTIIVTDEFGNNTSREAVLCSLLARLLGSMIIIKVSNITLNMKEGGIGYWCSSSSSISSL